MRGLKRRHWYGLLRKVPSPLQGTSQRTLSKISQSRGSSSARAHVRRRCGLPRREKRLRRVSNLFGSTSFATSNPLIGAERTMEEVVASKSLCMRDKSCSVLLPGAAHMSKICRRRHRRCSACVFAYEAIMRTRSELFTERKRAGIMDTSS